MSVLPSYVFFPFIFSSRFETVATAFRRYASLGFGPYAFSPGWLSRHRNTMSTIRPTIGKNTSKNHQPLLPVSWRRRQVTASPGRNAAKEYNALNPSAACAAPTIPRTTPIATLRFLFCLYYTKKRPIKLRKLQNRLSNRERRQHSLHFRSPFEAPEPSSTSRIFERNTGFEKRRALSRHSGLIM